MCLCDKGKENGRLLITRVPNPTCLGRLTQVLNHECMTEILVYMRRDICALYFRFQLLANPTDSLTLRPPVFDNMEADIPTTSQTDKQTHVDHIVPSGRCGECLQRREIADVIIIGAGAAGVAVALSVLEKVRDGWHIDSMLMIEKSEKLGPGNAYSSVMDDTVCNRRDDEMSLIYDQPDHFKDWLKKWQQKNPRTKRIGGDHSERQVYGEYLKKMLGKVVITAFQQMVDFKVIRKEAVDMDRYADGDAMIYGVKLDDGCFVYGKSVVLALGNFLKTTPKLVGTPGYFSNPWPLKKLDEIPTRAVVGIVGTGSSAFEVLTKLSQRRHEGMIYMMSESGRLPRLERPKRNFTETHVIHAAIRGLEKWKPTLESFLSSLEIMLKQNDENINVPQTNAAMTSYADHAYNRLLKDMGKFDQDEGRSLVVDALRPVAERIWTSTAPLERECLRNHPIWKDICQETIPPNIVAMYTAHVTGMKNLQIIEDEGVGSKQNYFLMGIDKRAKVDYVIDITGLEYDLGATKSSSPLLEGMHKKGLVTNEPSGGIKVGAADHQLITAGDKLTPGLYAIGSLTKGTHYFVEDISRITSHALRISDSIVGLPRSNPTQVALFVGQDLFSTIITMHAVPELLSRGHMPYVFLLESPVDSLYLTEKEWLYWYFELAVLQQVLIPDFKARGGAPPLALATDAVGNEYGVLVQSVRDVNDPAFLSGLSVHNIDIGFVIGSCKTVEDGLRNAFHLFRLRSGLHPLYRGTREVMQAGGERFGYTLDRLGTRDEGIYQDSFFAAKDRSIKGAPCACTATFDSYELAVELVTGAVDKYSRAGLVGGVRREFPPHLPEREEPVTLVTMPAILDRILTQFATRESEERLIRNIEDDIRNAGVSYDKRELEMWKAARNTDPEDGFI
ncbi:FAD-NAD(P)-binding-domain-containing protein [Hypoxylon cercidicola]|nr:FAD-NAD(P)-binding-domain-containing protein [Hypoxylon cercidicola]